MRLTVLPVHDAAMIYRYMTAAQICFYSSLLTVKVSLLTLYLRLLERTPAVYKKIWWGILVFCCLVSLVAPERAATMSRLT